RSFDSGRAKWFRDSLPVVTGLVTQPCQRSRVQFLEQCYVGRFEVFAPFADTPRTKVGFFPGPALRLECLEAVLSADPDRTLDGFVTELVMPEHATEHWFFVLNDVFIADLEYLWPLEFPACHMRNP